VQDLNNLKCICKTAISLMSSYVVVRGRTKILLGFGVL